MYLRNAVYTRVHASHKHTPDLCDWLQAMLMFHAFANARATLIALIKCGRASFHQIKWIWKKWEEEKKFKWISMCAMESTVSSLSADPSRTIALFHSSIYAYYCCVFRACACVSVCAHTNLFSFYCRPAKALRNTYTLSAIKPFILISYTKTATTTTRRRV